VSGEKIIAGLKNAVAGNFARVTIEGQTWVRADCMTAEDRVVVAVTADLAARAALGIKKYGVTLAASPADLRANLQHLYEELLDGANYAKRAMMKLDGEI
jgi:hypothetical protein